MNNLPPFIMNATFGESQVYKPFLFLLRQNEKQIDLILTMQTYC
jgi:hypothetical protein